MQKQSTVLCLTLLVLGSVYVAYFTDWFRTESIQIVYQPRMIAQRMDPKRGLETKPVFPIAFGFLRKYTFTSVQVVKTDELRNEKYPTPLWHLVSETNSRPTKALVYGVIPPGMRPAVDDSQPQPLEPGTSYTLLVEASGLKGATNFVPLAATLTR